MRLTFGPGGWDDYISWQQTDRKMLKRINTLIAATLREPFTGIGKPEQLRGELSGAWSRRIDQEHRLVYAVEGDDLVVLHCRHHYQDH